MLVSLLECLLLIGTVTSSKIVPKYSPVLVPNAPNWNANPVANEPDSAQSSQSTKRGYIELPISKRSNAHDGIAKRATTTPAGSPLQLTSNGAGYTAAIEFGTPAQTLNLILDTGSPLTWASSTNISSFTPAGEAAGETASALEKEICASNGCYATSESSTYRNSPAQVFSIAYVDASEAVGEIITDTATFAGLSVPAMEFGLVTYQYNPATSGAITGIIGLGPPTSLTGYPSLPDAIGPQSNTTDRAVNGPSLLNQFVSAGLIESDAFSLYLDAKGNGSVLLGGVDTAKYSGALTVVPIIDPEEQALQVTLISVAVNGSTTNAATVSAVVVLDSGTTEIYLPSAVVTLLAAQFGGTVTNNQPFVPCSALSPGTTVDFTFQNGAVIRTPVDLLVDLVGRQNGQAYCRMAIVATASDSYYLMGDYFLRSAYVVYNWAEQQIALAQIQYSASSNIIAIQTGTFGIPGAVYNNSSPGFNETGNVATVSGVSQPWSSRSSSSASSGALANTATLSLGLLLAIFLGTQTL